MITIIEYNAGNTRSVKNALNRLGYDCTISSNPDEIRNGDKVIFPGVGQARTAMNFLKEKDLDRLICMLDQPFLGICLGLQLMCKFSEESNTDCLGIFNSVVKRFPPEKQVPHMGWNNFDQLKGPLFKGIKRSDNVYFVHSYYAENCEHTTASCNYISSFSAAMQKDNFFATQFHPEKSAGIGETILKNFLEL